MFYKLHCNVNKNDTRKNRETCYTDNFIIQLKDAYNKNIDIDNSNGNGNYNGNGTVRKYTLKNRKKITAINIDDIIVDLKSNLLCSDERCWLQELHLNHIEEDKIISNFFLPHRPDTWIKKENTWVNNEDISQFMNAIQLSHKRYKFIGPSCINYNTLLYDNEYVCNELHYFNLQSLIQQKYNNIGIIFNTCLYNQPGKHWVALFIDIENTFIFYFDSLGKSMHKNIQSFIENVSHQAKAQNIIMKLHTNAQHIHQKSNTECGMYCMYFLYTMIKSKNTSMKIRHFKYDNITDDIVFKLRKTYYN
jgi:hypothetical protein